MCVCVCVFYSYVYAACTYPLYSRTRYTFEIVFQGKMFQAEKINFEEALRL